MIPFLRQCAEKILAGQDMRRVCVIFPTNRACRNFTKELGQLSGDTALWLPEIVPIQSFIYAQSAQIIPNEEELLIRLYDVYQSIQPVEEPFEKFYFWGKMMLQDFNEIDKYNVDAQRLFTIIKEHKEIESHFSIEEELKELAGAFWSQLIKDTPKKGFEEQFLETWRILGKVYHAYKTQLTDEHLAYEGMAYRSLLEALLADKITLPYDTIHWCGFNAFTTVEEQLVKVLCHRYEVHLHWDVDPYFMDEKVQRHEAGNFLRQYKGAFPAAIHHWEQAEMLHKNKKFFLHGAPIIQGQTQVAANIFNEKFEGKSIMVLCDEQMLEPLMAKIPSEMEVNISMGKSFQHSLLYTLLEHIYTVTHRTENNIWHKDISNLLNHHYFKKIVGIKGAALQWEIQKYKQIHVTPATIKSHFPPQVVKWLEPVYDIETLSSIWQEVLNVLYPQLSKDEQTTIDYLKDNFQISIQSIAPFIPKLSYEGVWKLVWSKIKVLSIPFHTTSANKPMEIMGFLETRLMDYDRVIIVGANEGLLPSGKSGNSFIPYNLRKGFGLPTLQEFDGIYAYHFYRLLKRASEIHLIYNNIQGDVSAERSRYLKQISLELNTPENKITEIDWTQSSESKTVEKEFLRIEKTAEHIQKLELQKFSASSLSTYLRCPVQFYLKYLAKIEEPDVMEEALDAGTFGNILHKTMELLYQDLKGKTLAEKDFAIKLQNENLLEACLKEAFESDDVKMRYDWLKGENLLARDVIKSSIKRLIRLDIALLKEAPFIITGLEESMSATLNIGGKEIKVYGKIDRIDLVNPGTLHEFSRILDYKTGKINAGKVNDNTEVWLEQYFNPEHAYQFKEGFQGWMYFYLSNAHRGAVGFYALKNLKSGISWLSPDQLITRNDAMVFEEKLKTLLTEILNPEIPFVQNENPKVYQYSPYSFIAPE
jgi:hypothetical protein